MNNLKRWEQFRSVPKEAQKAIGGGRLKGMTDINPVWRIKVLTEVYGACGVGWKYEIAKKELTDGVNGEVTAFVDVLLYVKEDDVWSEPIPGIGGSMYIAKESAGLRTNDEAFKMALTDALSVSCKALGIGADVYWQGGTKSSEYDQGAELSANIEKATEREVLELIELAKKKGQDEETLKLGSIKYYRIDNLRKLPKKSLAELKAKIEKLADVDIYEDTPFPK